MKGSYCMYLGMGAWLLTALVALDFGLGAFGQGFMMSNSFVMQNMQIVQYLVLAAAAWSLYHFVMAVQDGKCCR
jgi:hypothetical protein